MEHRLATMVPIALACEVHIDLLYRRSLARSPATVVFQRGNEIIVVRIVLNEEDRSCFEMYQPDDYVAASGVYDATRCDEFDAGGGDFVNVSVLRRSRLKSIKKILLTWVNSEVSMTVYAIARDDNEVSIVHAVNVRFGLDVMD
jgi:hypothetical protein